MTETLATGTALGRPIKRKEDANLLHGRTNWTDNIQLPGTLHMAILRSPMAHAKITKLDVSGALKYPGVHSAYGADELGALNGSIPCVWAVTPDMVAPDFPALAKGKVRQVGDCVAVVLADSAYQAADALEGITVEYDMLPAVIDMEEALTDKTLLHDDKGTNKCYTYKLQPSGDGSYEAAAAKADVIVKRRFINQRLIPAFMEPRAVLASPMGVSDEVTVWSSTQIPHVLRVLLALVTGIAENKLRINMTAQASIVLARAEKALTPEDWKAIEAAFEGNDDPIADLRTQDFHTVYQRILNIAPAPIGLGERWKPAT